MRGNMNRKQKAFLLLKQNWIFCLFFWGMVIYYGYNMFVIKPWYDELYTYYSFISRGPVYSAIHWPVPNNHVFYSVLSAFLDYLGNPYIGLRGVSYLAAAANLYLLYCFAGKFVNRYLAAGAVFLYAAVFQVNNLAVQGRGYTLSITFYLIVLLCLVERMNGFLRECFGDECACLPIFFESRHRHQRRGSAVGVVAVVEFAQIGGKTAGSVTGNVDVEPKVMRVLTRGVDCSPMRLAAVNGVISGVVQQLHHRGGDKRVWRAGSLANAVVVPFGRLNDVAFAVHLGVAAQCPVGHSVSGGICSGEQAATAW